VLYKSHLFTNLLWTLISQSELWYQPITEQYLRPKRGQNDHCIQPKTMTSLFSQSLISVRVYDSALVSAKDKAKK